MPASDNILDISILMPFKILVTQPSNDPPPSDQPKSPTKKVIKKKKKPLTKQAAQGDESEEFEFDGVMLDDDDAAALLAEIEGDDNEKAYQSVKDAPRRPSAPSAYEYKENKNKSPSPSPNSKPPVPRDTNLNTDWSNRSKSVEPERKESTRLSPMMTQSLYSMTDDGDDDDLFDGLDLDDEDAAKLLEEFEVEAYDQDVLRRARSATPSPISASAPSSGTATPTKKKVIKKVVRKKKISDQNEVSASLSPAQTPRETTPAQKSVSPAPKTATAAQTPVTTTTKTTATPSKIEEKKPTTKVSKPDPKSASTSNLASDTKTPSKATSSSSQKSSTPAPATSKEITKDAAPKKALNSAWEEKISKQNESEKTLTPTKLALQKKFSQSPSPQPESKPKKSETTAKSSGLTAKTEEKPTEERRKSLLDVINERKAAAAAGKIASQSPSPSPEPEAKKEAPNEPVKKVWKKPDPEPKVEEKKVTPKTATLEPKPTTAKTTKDSKTSDKSPEKKDHANGTTAKKPVTTEAKSSVPYFATTGKKETPKKKLGERQNSQNVEPPVQKTTVQKQGAEAPSKKATTTSKPESKDPTKTASKIELKDASKTSMTSPMTAQKKPVVPQKEPEFKPEDLFLKAKSGLRKVDLPEAKLQPQESLDIPALRATSVPPSALQNEKKPNGLKTVKNDEKSASKTPAAKSDKHSASALAAPEQKRARTPTPAELKYGRKDANPRDDLLNSIKAGGFKLKHVETNDKSSGVLKTPDQDTRASSVPPAPSLAPPPPPGGLSQSPAQLKHAKPEPDARQALLNSIKAGGFKLRKVETNDRSGLIVGEEERARAASTPPQPPPPPGLGPPPPNRAPSPAVLKHGKGEISARDELFNSIKAGGFKLRKVETKDKSGLIIDDEMLASGCKVVENQPAEAPPPPPAPKAPAAPAAPKAPVAPKVAKAPAAPVPPPPPPAAPAPPKPKVNKPITDPRLLKLGGKDVQPNRAELFNAIKQGGFKLRKVEIVDKSAPVLVEGQEVETISTSGYVSVAAPPPPPGPPPPPPPIPTGPREKRPITNPALLKLGGKDAKPDIEALFNSIKSGGIRLRKVETRDKSGLILDDEQLAKKQASEQQEGQQEEPSDGLEKPKDEPKPKVEEVQIEEESEGDEESEESEESDEKSENEEDEEIEAEEIEFEAEEITVSKSFKLK